MPTTDPSIAAAVLESLRRAGTDFALLQSAAALRSSAPTSDIDVVTDTAPAVALPRVLEALDQRGISLATLWHYDVGGAATAFFFSENGNAGAQVDMLYDPEGIGHYSVRSTELLAAKDDDPVFPAVSTPELSVYLVSKRLRKRQPEALAAARADLALLPDTDLAALVARVVTSPTLATAILGPTQAHIVPKARGRVARERAARVLDRLRRPIGFWVHLPGEREDIARSIAERFGRVLVHSSADRYPAAAGPAWIWFARDVQPIRLRPGLLASWGAVPTRRGPTPDLTIDSSQDHPDEVDRLVIAGMAARHRGG